MVNVNELECWKCGASLAYLLLPLSRRAECKSCAAKLHVCKMCAFYAPRVAKQCREPVAEEVREKTKPNFCDYLQLTANTHQHDASSPSASSQDDLNALFGVDSHTRSAITSDESSQAMDALNALNALFDTQDDADKNT